MNMAKMQLNLNTVRHRYGRLQSLDDIDLEVQNPTDQRAVLFLKHKVDKIWKTLEQINETLYHEDTATIVQEKPVFDEEKKKLLMLSTIVEKQLNAGNYIHIKEGFHAREYSDYLLKTNTNFANWNTLATETNDLIREIQKVEKIEKSFYFLEKQSSKGAGNLENRLSLKRKSRLFAILVAVCLAALIIVLILNAHMTSWRKLFPSL